MMAKDKKPAPDEADADGVEAETEGEEQPKKKGFGLIPMAAAAVVAASVAGGAAFVLAPGGESACVEDEGAACEADDSHEEKKDSHAKQSASKGHGGKSSDGHGGKSGQSTIKPLGEIQHTEFATFLAIEPLVVSIQPIGRSKHLKIALVLETDDESAEILLENGYYVQDVLNTFLRSVDASVLEDPASMSRLRAQILRRIRAIAPDADVKNVLITEFILT